MLATGAAAATATVLAGCGMTVPVDPNGSINDIRGHELRVGLALEPRLSTAGDPPQGPLPELAEEFASTLDARPTWETGSEESLVRMLEDDEIDLALGDFSPETPWTDRAAVSRPFSVDASASSTELVALMPLGENALLSEFERFVDAKEMSR